MANFLYIIDPDENRRRAMATRAAAPLAFLPRLEHHHVEDPGATLLIACAPHAPVSHDTGWEGSRTHVIGEPLSADNQHVRPAASFAAALQIRFDAPSEANGFYAAIHHHPRAGWRIEADVLGVFPIYYWSRGDVLLAGSSAHLFALHPQFETAADSHGLASLLLTGGLTDGATLLRGVRRLAADHGLFFDAVRGAREIDLSPGDGGAAESPDAPIEEITERVAAMHRRFLATSLAASRRPGILLSGGLDSRLLAGLAAEAGSSLHGCTFGREGDMDAACAGQVARTLGWSRTVIDAGAALYPDFAHDSAAWEQLSGGLYALPMGWNLAHASVDPAPDRIVCGLTLDAVIGGAKGVVNTADGYTFDDLRLSELGLDSVEWENLVRDPELKRHGDGMRQRLPAQYRELAPTDELRAWRTNLLHRQRFAVGSCAWRYSLFAWPVLPALDRGLLSLAARLPAEFTRGRRIQTTLLKQRFPALAALDLDRNYFDAPPLVPRRSRWSGWSRKIAKFRRRAGAWLGRDARFYVRTMDFNSSGWRGIRHAAEPGRSALERWFHRPALDRLLPPPNRTARRRSDPIIHSTPLKNLTGLMLWLRRFS